MVDGPSEVVVHPVDLHVDLVQLPLSVMVRKHRLDALVPDLYWRMDSRLISIPRS